MPEQDYEIWVTGRGTSEPIRVSDPEAPEAYKDATSAAVYISIALEKIGIFNRVVTVRKKSTGEVVWYHKTVAPRPFRVPSRRPGDVPVRRHVRRRRA